MIFRKGSRFIHWVITVTLITFALAVLQWRGPQPYNNGIQYMAWMTWFHREREREKDWEAQRVWEIKSPLAHLYWIRLRVGFTKRLHLFFRYETSRYQAVDKAFTVTFKSRDLRLTVKASSDPLVLGIDWFCTWKTGAICYPSEIYETLSCTPFLSSGWSKISSPEWRSDDQLKAN